jgi:hypothetical protein
MLFGSVGEAAKGIGKSMPRNDGVDLTGTETALILSIKL